MELLPSTYFPNDKYTLPGLRIELEWARDFSVKPINYQRIQGMLFRISRRWVMMLTRLAEET